MINEKSSIVNIFHIFIFIVVFFNMNLFANSIFIENSCSNFRNPYFTEKRWSFTLSGNRSIISYAHTLPTILISNYGEKYGGFIGVGFDLLNFQKQKYTLKAGLSFRNYGFKENSSSIPYICAAGQAEYRKILFWRFALHVLGGIEYGKLIENKYHFPYKNQNDHNLFLHQNDMLTLNYGGGITLLFKEIQLDFGFENNLQLDNFDLFYGKTVGGKFMKASILYYWK